MRWMFGVALASALCCAGGSVHTQSSLGRITGHVNDAGIVIIIHNPGEGTFKKTVSDASGNYVFDDLPTGTYTAEFMHEIRDSVRQHGVRVVVGNPAPELSPILDLVPMCECVERPRIADPGHVTGTVNDANGRPIANSRLEIRGARTEQALSGPNGEFSLTLPAGTTWRLTASDTYFLSDTREIRVGRTNPPLRIALTPRWGVELSGTETLRRGCTCYGDLFTHRNR